MISLRNIAFEVTTDCNLKCTYCYNHWKCDGAYTRLNSYHKASKVLKQLFKIADIKQITFTGGEPFLAERFIELALFCRLQNKTVAVISNGNIGKENDYKSLISLGIKLFQIPFLSNNKLVHDSITGVNGSWEKAFNSITEIVLQGGFVVPVIVLTKTNYPDLHDTLKFLHTKSLNRIMLNRYNIGGIGKNSDNISLSKSEIESAFKVADELAQTNEMVITSNVCSPMCYINPSSFPRIAFGNCSGDATLRPITVTIEGDVRLCNHSPIVAGNIFKENFESIFNSDYAKMWTDIKPEYCSDCDLYNKCRGGCRAASEQLGLSLAHPDPIIKRM